MHARARLGADAALRARERPVDEVMVGELRPPAQRVQVREDVLGGAVDDDGGDNRLHAGAAYAASATSCAVGTDVARALTIMNGNYLLDALVREPRQAPEVALETLMTVWTGGCRASCR